MDVRVSLLIALEALFALFLLYRSGCIKTAAQWSAVAALLLTAFVPRLLAMKYETLDYQDFLAPWVVRIFWRPGWNSTARTAAFARCTGRSATIMSPQL